MRLIAQTIRQTAANPSRPWINRIVLGVWAVSMLNLFLVE